MQREFAHTYFSAEKIKLRAHIIREGVTAPNGSVIKYMDDKELTELDRRLIQLTRSVLATTRMLTENVREVPAKSLEAARTSIAYFQGVLSHITEARSISDLTGIGLNESRRALENIKEVVPLTKNFELLDRVIDWMVSFQF